MIYFILACLSATVVFAQGLTLESAKQIALASNPKFKQMESDVEIARATKLKTISAHLPQVAISGRHLFDEKFQSEEISFGGGAPTNFQLIEPFTDISAMVSLMVFDGLSAWNYYKAAVSNHAAAELSLNRAKFLLEEDIKIKFYQALGSRDMIEVAEQNIQVLGRHLEDMQNQIKGGVATKLDELRIEVQLEDAKTELLSAKDNLELAEAKLSQALGVEKLPGRISGKMPSISIEAINKADLSLGQREDRIAQQAKDESSHFSAKAAKGQWYPKINLYAKKMLYNNSNTNFSDPKFNDAYWLGMTLTWNVFDGGATWANSTIADEQLKKTDQELRAINQAIPIDIDFWKRRLIHSAASYRAGTFSLKKSEESVRLARSAVRAGMRTNADLLDAELELFNSRTKVVRAQLDAVESEANLESALGKKLNLLQ